MDEHIYEALQRFWTHTANADINATQLLSTDGRLFTDREVMADWEDFFTNITKAWPTLDVALLNHPKGSYRHMLIVIMNYAPLDKTNGLNSSFDNMANMCIRWLCAFVGGSFDGVLAFNYHPVRTKAQTNRQNPMHDVSQEARAVIVEYVSLLFAKSSAPFAAVMGKQNYERYFASHRGDIHPLTIGNHKLFDRQPINAVLEYSGTSAGMKITRLVFFFPHAEAFLRGSWAKPYARQLSINRAVLLALVYQKPAPIRQLSTTRLNAGSRGLIARTIDNAVNDPMPLGGVGSVHRIVSGKSNRDTKSVIAVCRLLYFEVASESVIPRNAFPDLLTTHLDYDFDVMTENFFGSVPHLARYLHKYDDPNDTSIFHAPWLTEVIDNCKPATLDFLRSPIGKLFTSDMWPVIMSIFDKICRADCVGSRKRFLPLIVYCLSEAGVGVSKLNKRTSTLRKFKADAKHTSFLNLIGEARTTASPHKAYDHYCSYWKDLYRATGNKPGNLKYFTPEMLEFAPDDYPVNLAWEAVEQLHKLVKPIDTMKRVRLLRATVKATINGRRKRKYNTTRRPSPASDAFFRALEACGDLWK
jgi:hypothetical protein